MDFGAKTACKANEILAQGNALGCNNGVDCALQGQKHYDYNTPDFSDQCISQIKN